MECPICQKELKQITPQHIQTHGITLEEFKNLYPNTFLGNYGTIKRQSKEKQDRIDIYNKNPCICLQCGENISYKSYILADKNPKFCSHSCSATYSNKMRAIIKDDNFCLCCGETLKKNADSFCSHSCFGEFAYLSSINKWKLGIEFPNKHLKIPRYIRIYMFSKYNNKCSCCGWGEINPSTNKSPLEIEHIDGDYTNNKEENLTLLCPNCHSLTPTYKALNKGNGREYRRQNNLVLPGGIEPTIARL